MINWKTHAKRFFMNWKYCDDLAMAHYGRYRNWKDRAKRAEARVEELKTELSMTVPSTGDLFKDE